MVIKLLPASVPAPDSPDEASASTSLVSYARGAVPTRANASSEIAPASDTYVWSTPPGRGTVPRIYGTPVEDSESEDASDETGRSAWEYVSGSWWGPSIERAATALYSMYSGMLTAGSGQLLNVYA
jgi:hypothetical protein